jgi:hypothetical protein
MAATIPPDVSKTVGSRCCCGRRGRSEFGELQHEQRNPARALQRNPVARTRRSALRSAASLLPCRSGARGRDGVRRRDGDIVLQDAAERCTEGAARPLLRRGHPALGVGGHDAVSDLKRVTQEATSNRQIASHRIGVQTRPCRPVVRVLRRPPILLNLAKEPLQRTPACPVRRSRMTPHATPWRTSNVARSAGACISRRASWRSAVNFRDRRSVSCARR